MVAVIALHAGYRRWGAAPISGGEVESMNALRDARDLAGERIVYGGLFVFALLLAAQAALFGPKNWLIRRAEAVRRVWWGMVLAGLACFIAFLYGYGVRSLPSLVFGPAALLLWLSAWSLWRWRKALPDPDEGEYEPGEDPLVFVPVSGWAFRAYLTLFLAVVLVLAGVFFLGR